MDIGQLQAFVTVAELQSFSKAAQHLHLTQSAVSKRIAALESFVDIALFERFGQRIQLTEAGQVLLLDARAILDKVQDMQRHSESSKKHISGTLRIATSHHIGLYRLPPLLQAFAQRYPAVRLDMHFTDSEKAYEDIGRGRFDLAIATLPQTAEPNIIATPLWQDQLVIMFAQDHAINAVKQPDAAILAEHPAILPDQDTFTRRIIDEVFADSGIRYRLAFTTNYLETIKVMVEAGLGWSVLPKIMLNPALAFRELGHVQASRKLGVIHHKNKVMTPALTAFLKML